MDKAAFGGGQYITFPIWGVEVQTIEEKDKDPALEETEICTVEEKDRGWQIEAKDQDSKGDTYIQRLCL